jgi:hypothetical protein
VSEDEEEGPGGDVPGREANLPEAVQAPGGDVCDVEGGGAAAAYTLGAFEKSGELGQVVTLAVVTVIWEASCQQAVDQIAILADPEPFFLVSLAEERAVTDGAVEALVAEWVVNDACQGLLSVVESQ